MSVTSICTLKTFRKSSTSRIDGFPILKYWQYDLNNANKYFAVLKLPSLALYNLILQEYAQAIFNWIDCDKCTPGGVLVSSSENP